MPSSLERIVAFLGRKPNQGDQVGNSIIINPADSVGKPGQTIIRPLVIRIEPEVLPVTLDETGQIVTPESVARYPKIIPTDPIINPGRPGESPMNRHVLINSGVLPLRKYPYPKIIRKLIGKS